eukprot:6691236-Prorocentrum_lima.AAC.1
MAQRPDGVNCDVALIPCTPRAISSGSAEVMHATLEYPLVLSHKRCMCRGARFPQIWSPAPGHGGVAAPVCTLVVAFLGPSLS